MISITATIFITKPALVICLSWICPLANTIAFGGVPIGSMLAQLAASVIAIPSISGFIPIATASEDTTGAKTMTCATLLITSLKNIVIIVTANKRIK